MHTRSDFLIVLLKQIAITGVYATWPFTNKVSMIRDIFCTCAVPRQIRRNAKTNTTNSQADSSIKAQFSTKQRTTLEMCHTSVFSLCFLSSSSTCLQAWYSHSSIIITIFTTQQHIGRMHQIYISHSCVVYRNNLMCIVLFVFHWTHSLHELLEGRSRDFVCC